MKMTATIALIVTLTAGCDILKTKSNDNNRLTATFSLTDTAGHAAMVLNSGDHFLITFSIINTTDHILTYSYTGTPIWFEILESDRMVASSTDGAAILQYFQAGSVAPGDTFGASWKAPTTPLQNPKIVLMPGSYKAVVLFSRFTEAEVDSVPPMNFTITH